MPDGSPHPDMQLNVMSVRAVALVAQAASAGRWRAISCTWTWISPREPPAWTKLAIGTAVIEVTDQPHTGCAKFVERFGVDAMKFVNSSTGRALRLRGLNCPRRRPGHHPRRRRRPQADRPGSRSRPALPSGHVRDPRHNIVTDPFPDSSSLRALALHGPAGPVQSVIR
jgi:hypothetical protein